MSGRNTDGTFTAGNAGRPKGARNRTTQAVLALLEGEAEAIGRKAVEMALAGDSVALRLCLDRLAPPRRDDRLDPPSARDVLPDLSGRLLDRLHPRILTGASP